MTGVRILGAARQCFPWVVVWFHFSCWALQARAFLRFTTDLLDFLLQFLHSAGHRHNRDDMTLSSRAGSTRLRPLDDTNDFVRLNLCSPFSGCGLKLYDEEGGLVGVTSNGIDMCTTASEKLAFVMTGSCLERHDGNIIYSTVHFSTSRLPLANRDGGARHFQPMAACSWSRTGQHFWSGTVSN